MILGVLVGLLAVGDVAAKATVESQLSDRVQRSVRSSGSASADVDSFPFLGRLLVAGQVSRVRVRVEGVGIERIRLAAVVVDLRDVRLDRNRLLSERRAVLRSIGTGEAWAEISEEELTRLVGVPVRLEDGEASVTIEGRRISVKAGVRDNVLRLEVAGRAIPAISLPKIPLVPCVTDVTVDDGVVRLSCRITDVPVELAGRRAEVQL